jgi:type IV pilus assembly protein PilA
MVNPNRKLSGFTFKELLIVTGIIGTLVAIISPRLLGQMRRDDRSEAVNLVGKLVRTQQALLLEKQRFAVSIAELDSSIPSETQFYMYSLENHKSKIFVFGKPKQPGLKSYAAGVFANSGSKDKSESIICLAKELGTQPLMPPIDAQTCSEGTTKY